MAIIDTIIVGRSSAGVQNLARPRPPEIGVLRSAWSPAARLRDGVRSEWARWGVCIYVRREGHNDLRSVVVLKGKGAKHTLRAQGRDEVCTLCEQVGGRESGVLVPTAKSVSRTKERERGGGEEQTKRRRKKPSLFKEKEYQYEEKK